MGQPGRLKACHAADAAGERGELKHLSTRRKSPNHACSGTHGVVGPRDRKKHGEWKRLEHLAIAGERPVHEAMRSVAVP